MKKKIILIEDDENTCMLFKHVLSKAGYDVRHYFDASFIFASDYEAPDLYILDNCLPGIDGVALTKFMKIRNDQHNIPVLIISGNFPVLKEIEHAGTSVFVAKPLEATHLLEVVHNLLESHSYVEDDRCDGAC